MPLAKFDDFLKSLHGEIVRLEFAHYDYQNQVSKNVSIACVCVAMCTLHCSPMLTSLFRLHIAIHVLAIY